ncbi:suppressor of fused domain protein [Kineococcus sp. SYSU DK004]|uniref:suppressor of fused domain protein n=1 Tax=Kineococcus sp. SYSU DK004 TaxID=3383125 RepID=UPI003D7EF8C8
MSLVEPSDAEVAMARYVARRLSPGAWPVIEPYLDRTQEHELHLMTCPDAPRPGHVTVSTLSMHRRPNPVDGEDVRVELVTTLRHPDVDLCSGLVVACAFTAVKERLPVRAGTVFPDVVGELLGGRTRHLLVTAPWSFPTLARYPLTPQVDVRWLQAVPVHDAERDHAERSGPESLVELLHAAGADLADLDRAPVPLPA